MSSASSSNRSPPTGDQRDRRTLQGQPARGRRTDPTARPGHERDSTGQRLSDMSTSLLCRWRGRVVTHAAARSRPARAPCSRRTKSATPGPRGRSGSRARPCAAAARRSAPARSSSRGERRRCRVDPTRQPGCDLLQHPAVAVRIAERQERAVAVPFRIRTRHARFGPGVMEDAARIVEHLARPRLQVPPTRPWRPRCRRRSGAVPVPSPAAGK